MCGNDDYGCGVWRAMAACMWRGGEEEKLAASQPNTAMYVMAGM